MGLEKTAHRLRVIGRGLAAVLAIYRESGSVKRTTGALWWVLTREGLIGLREWLIRSAPQPEALPPPEPEPEPEPLPEPELEPEPEPPDQVAQRAYAAWLQKYDTLAPESVEQARQHARTLALPELLIVALLHGDNAALLPALRKSWDASVHPGWRAAVIVDDGDLPSKALEGDDRVQIATAEQVEALRGRFPYMLVGFGPALLNELTAYLMLEAALRTGADAVYADHDRIDADGTRREPAFKPQYSPEYLARYNYVGPCVLLSQRVPAASLLNSLSLPAFDTALAAVLAGRRVEHVPFILHHQLASLPHAVHDVPSVPDSGPTAAIIIPTRDGVALLRACVESILTRTSYDLSLVELVIVDNGSSDPETLDYLSELADRPDVRIVPYPAPFNFAEINNVGARATDKEILVFLNNDTLVHDPAWLSKLVWYAAQAGVGVVGCKLLFPDGTIQHAGCVAGASSGTVQHLLSQADAAAVDGLDHTREISLVTGACMAVSRSVFRRIGGFDPILRITWNDVKVCLGCLAIGLRNIYVADPLLIHDESQTRGQDNTLPRFLRYFAEGNYVRRPFRAYFQDDPSYNPNLSLANAGDLAEPPRGRRPWLFQPGQPARLLVLSAVYKTGFGVPLVIQQQVRALQERGFTVVIGGPLGDNEFAFPDCERVALDSVTEAASYALREGIALAICHTPPFFELPIIIGPHIPVLSYDYGEPPAELLPEPARSYLLEVSRQKRRAAPLTTAIATISQAVKDERLEQDAVVIGLGNSHLPAWSEAFRRDRARVREARGWSGAFVVLTVSRFHENERGYKGLDTIAAILREFPFLYPGKGEKVIWVLAGRGTPEDVLIVEELGFTVLPNVTDDEMADLYKAADAYMSFSKWEGYNLGISQALAMGLPILASDIPAHREFPVTTTNSVLAACNWVAREIDLRAAESDKRQATVYEWSRNTGPFSALVESLLADAASQPPRAGASAVTEPGRAAA